METSMKIGITGLPGAGKTHALMRVIEMLEDEGVIVGGMVTESVADVKGQREGFKVVNWMTKEEGMLAHVSIKSKITVSKYGVDLQALDDIGVTAINQAAAEAELIIIDEVGKMEVESPMFIDAVKNALDTSKALILTLHKKSRNPLLQDIRRRDDVRILEVTPVNVNILPTKIIRLLYEEPL